MVEIQHGIKSILSFGAKSVKPEILEKLLVGRRTLADQLEKKVKNIALDGLNHQVILLGARGMGKTHLLSVIYNRAQSLKNEEKIKIAYFAEEEYGIASFLDFLVRIINAFIRWNDNDAEFLREQLSILHETPTIYQESTVQRIIQDYIGELPLLILVENFNEILDGLGQNGQAKLRNWLQENQRISIIATSQSLSKDIGKEEKPFYGFFEEIHVKPLTLDESYELLESLAELDENEIVLNHLKTKGKTQIKAIHELVKGNHRLLVTFYQFLKSDTLADLSVLFIKTLNDLKPYYETYIRYLAPQHQKIIRFLALARIPQKGVNIAKECFVPQKSLSKHMSELARLQLIDVITDPEDRRNKLYDISEPLLRISIEIGEHKEGISALFIDFLALYYNENELETQKQQFLRIYEECQNANEKEKFGFELIAREKAIKLKKKLIDENEEIFISKFNDLIENKKYAKAHSLLEEFFKNNIDENYYYLLSKLYASQEQYKEAKENILQCLELDYESAIFWSFLGFFNVKLKEYENAIKAFKKAIELKKDIAIFYKFLSDVYQTLEDLDNQILYLEKALKLDSNNDEWSKGLIYAYLFNGQLEKGQQLALRVYDENEFPWDIHLLIGAYKGFNEEIDASNEHISRAYNLNPNSFYTVIAFVAHSFFKQDLKKGLCVFYDFLKANPNLRIKEKESFECLVPIIPVFIVYDITFNLEKYDNLVNLFSQIKSKSEEFKTIENFLHIFKRIILDKEEKALYELPKEQRVFFQKEILDVREKYINQK